MANKYWINGGVDNLWATSGNWSTTSGGSGGAGQPTTSDVAIFDTNSANYACTISANEVCTDLRFEGTYTGTFTINNQLQTYGDVTFKTGMTLAGTGTLWFYEDNTGGLITSAGLTLPWNLYFGGISGGNWTLQDDLNCSGTLLYFQATNDTSANTLDDGGLYKVIFTGSQIRTANVSGSFSGDVVIDIRANCELWFRGSSDSYGFGLTINMTTANTLTIKGYNFSRICRIYNSFKLIMADVATLAFDGGSIPDNIPYFYGCGTVLNAHIDTGDQAVEYRVYFRSAVSSTSYWYDDTDGAQNTIGYFNHAYSSALSWRLYNFGSKLFVDQFAYNSTTGSCDFRGDADIEFRIFDFERNSNASVTHDYDSDLTVIVTERFRYYNNQEGLTTLASTDGVARANIHLLHNCQVELHNVAMTRIDGRSDGQGIGLEGDDATITDCLGVYNGHHAFAYGYIQNDVAGVHPLYTNDNLGKTPVTVSGTVKIGATPQQYARVLVLVMRRESPDGTQIGGNYWGALREYWKLQHVLVTDVNGEFTCQVPSGVEVVTEVFYDSGAQKYNSLSKPYIDAT